MPRLTDDYDAAQERGKVQKLEKVEVPNRNLKPATLKELGISKKDVFETRQVRRAEQADRGIVRSALDARPVKSRRSLHCVKR